MTEDERIPTALWVEGQLRALTAEGRNYYIVQKGAYAAGTVLVKVNAFEKGCLVLIQQRDLDGNLGWSPVLGDAPVEEAKADDYIKRATARDPDLWVIEVEDKESRNPFDGKTI
jgi:hypothetical protein